MTSSLTPPRAQESRRLTLWSLGAGAATLAACIAGAFFFPVQFFRAYLSAYQFVLGVALGCLVLLMVYHLTGGAWGFLIRSILEAGTRTLPLLAVLFVPILFGLPYLYEWAGPPEEIAAVEGLRHKQPYLNVPFFIGRAALYFALWLTLAFLLNLWSRAERQTDDPAPTRRMGRLSGPGLVVYGLTMLFASVDWVMSLQTSYRSTIFGLLFASGHVVSAQAFALLILAWLIAEPPVAEYRSVEALNDLGNLLLTYIVVWAYLAFFQLMLSWIANLPYEVVWYLPRSRGGWQWVAWALFVLHFAVPFLLLLMRDVKRNPPAVAAVAGLVLFMQLVYDYFQVQPAFAGTTIADHWMDFLTPLGLGGLWLAYFLWQLGRAPLVSAHDPNREPAAHYHEIDREAAAREEELDLE